MLTTFDNLPAHGRAECLPGVPLKPTAGRLSLTVSLHERETLLSFVSRLSVRNGFHFVQDFCRHIGLVWSDLVNGDAGSIRQLADLSGACRKDLSRFAVKVQRHHFYRLNGEFLTSEIAKRYDQRFCPSCIADDFAGGSKNNAFGRAEWQLASFRACPEHHVKLIKLPRSSYPRSPYDFAGRIADYFASPNQQSCVTAVSAKDVRFEAYLRERVHGRDKRIWLDKLNLDVATKLVQTLGTVIAHGAEAKLSCLDEVGLSTSEQVGFNTLGATLHDLNSGLDVIAGESKTGGRNFHKDFGAVTDWLSRVDHCDPRFATVLDALAAFAFARYPIPPDHSVFGRKCSQRRVHRLSSGAREFGIDPLRLKKFLRANGLPEGSFDKGVVFPVDRYKSEIRQLAECLTATEAADQLGLGYDAFKRLCSSRSLKAKYDLPGLARCYHPGDIWDLLDRTLGHASRCEHVPFGYEDLLSLCVKTRCPIEELLELASAGKLQSLCSAGNDLGFRGVFADPEEVWNQLAVDPETGITKVELKTLLRVNDSTLKYLTENNFLELRTVNRSRRKRPVGLVGVESLRRFVSDHVTLGLIALDEGIQAQGVHTKFQRLGIDPLPLCKKLSLIYRRSDISALGYEIKSASQHFEAMITRLYHDLRDASQAGDANLSIFRGVK